MPTVIRSFNSSHERTLGTNVGEYLPGETTFECIHDLTMELQHSGIARVSGF